MVTFLGAVFAILLLVQLVLVVVHPIVIKRPWEPNWLDRVLAVTVTLTLVLGIVGLIVLSVQGHL